MMILKKKSINKESIWPHMSSRMSSAKQVERMDDEFHEASFIAPTALHRFRIRACGVHEVHLVSEILVFHGPTGPDRGRYAIWRTSGAESKDATSKDEIDDMGFLRQRWNSSDG